MSADLSGLDAVQSRRFMLRFDLPVQDLAKYSEEQIKAIFEATCTPKNDEGSYRWNGWGQLELGGRSGRYHIQAYIETASAAPLRAGTIVRAVRAVTDTEDKTVSVHISKARKKAENCIGYVTKEKTRIWGPWSNVPRADWPVADDNGGHAKRDDLYSAVMDDGLSVGEILASPELAITASGCMSWLDRIAKLKQQETYGSGSPKRKVETIYLYGASDTGKSTIAEKYLHDVAGQVFIMSDYRRDPWDGYDGEHGLLMDDLRLPTPLLGLQEMLQLLDGRSYMLARRYANTYAAFTHIAITSNWSPERQWASMCGASSLLSPLTEEDQAAFYRRLTRVLHVDGQGVITDETAKYHQAISGRKCATVDQLRQVLSAPIPPATPASAPDPFVGVNVFDAVRVESMDDLFDYLNLDK